MIDKESFRPNGDGPDLNHNGDGADNLKPRKLRVAVIGGGGAGLGGLGQVLEAGFDATLFEARWKVGGAW
jgi:NADPH-dependent glutamate synthase beta subunit-like oxidoreductase